MLKTLEKYVTQANYLLYKISYSNQIINWKQTLNLCLGKFTLSDQLTIRDWIQESATALCSSRPNCIITLSIISLNLVFCFLLVCEQMTNWFDRLIYKFNSLICNTVHHISVFLGNVYKNILPLFSTHEQLITHKSLVKNECGVLLKTFSRNSCNWCIDDPFYLNFPKAYIET